MADGILKVRPWLQYHGKKSGGGGERKKWAGTEEIQTGIKLILKPPQESPGGLHGSSESSDWHHILLPGLQKRGSPPLLKESPHLRHRIRQPHLITTHSFSGPVSTFA